MTIAPAPQRPSIETPQTNNEPRLKRRRILEITAGTLGFVGLAGLGAWILSDGGEKSTGGQGGGTAMDPAKPNSVTTPPEADIRLRITNHPGVRSRVAVALGAPEDTITSANAFDFRKQQGESGAVFWLRPDGSRAALVSFDPRLDDSGKDSRYTQYMKSVTRDAQSGKAPLYKKVNVPGAQDAYYYSGAGSSGTTVFMQNEVISVGLWETRPLVPVDKISREHPMTQLAIKGPSTAEQSATLDIATSLAQEYLVVPN